MEAAKKNRQIANGYYNLGLERAQRRDMTGAVDALKTSLRYDKYQTDARNLLGLIYNEIGEVAAALTQWIISLNLQEEGNLAEEYLRRLQEAGGYIELADQAAKKYNQALAYAQNDNEDLAILMLMRMLDDFPNYVKAEELLALLYIHQEDYVKAGGCLYRALKIDRYQPTAQRYMELVKRHTGRADVEKRKMKNAFSHKQMQDDDVIMPPSYKENTGWQTILNILVGLALGIAVVYYLVLPGKVQTMNRAHNQEVQENLEVINQKSLEIDRLTAQVEEAKQAQTAAEKRLNVLVDDKDGVLTQYQNFVQILQAYRDEDMQQAALLYVDTDMEVLKDGVLDASVAWVQSDMAERGHQLLMQAGDTAMAQENGVDEAIQYYAKSLQLKADNPEVLYKLGCAYQKKEDKTMANQYFGEVIMNYPDSDYAKDAKTQRGY